MQWNLSHTCKPDPGDKAHRCREALKVMFMGAPFVVGTRYRRCTYLVPGPGSSQRSCTNEAVQDKNK